MHDKINNNFDNEASCSSTPQKLFVDPLATQ